MLTINLKKSLTRDEADTAIRSHLPELKAKEIRISPDGDAGRWWWGTCDDFEHDWSGYVHQDGRVEGPY